MKKTIEINSDVISVETETYLHDYHCPSRWLTSGMTGAIVHHIVDVINWELDADYTTPYVIHQWLVKKTLDSRFAGMAPSTDYKQTIHNMLDKIAIQVGTDKQRHILINKVTIE
ncbi:MAG: hypothetical protein IIZ94_11960 [Prevotella sp.]|nr:hypothetical protein [Prevotella sp.]